MAMLVVVAAALWVPVRFAVRVEAEAALLVHARLSWGAGLLAITGAGIVGPGYDVRLHVVGLALRLPLRRWIERGARASRARRERGARAVRRRPRALWRNARQWLRGDVLAVAWRAVRRLAAAQHLRMRELDVEFGFEDPALTGLAAAALHAIPPLRGRTIRPNFETVGMRGRFEVSGWMMPATALAIMGQALLARPVRHLLWRRMSRRRGGWRAAWGR